VEYALQAGWAAHDAERAFDRALRARRWASVLRRILRRCLECAQLGSFDPHVVLGGNAHRGVQEIPLDAIAGSLEPHRAAQFDSEFRPSAAVRHRWLSVWRAEAAGTTLPPISVVRVGDAYAISDGHHRVSVARARGAQTIPAIVS
jgi:ParB-like nuclease domain